jgi:hypothetical protein
MRLPGKFLACRTVSALSVFAALSAVALTTTPTADWSAVTSLPTNLQPSVAKLPRFFDQQTSSEFVLLGSSLVSMAAGRSDDLFNNVRPRMDSWYVEEHIAQYPRAHFLSTKLSQRIGQNVSVDNLAVNGASISDNYLIFKRVMERSNKPVALVCGIAPRDFIANDAPDVEESQVFHVLAEPGELLHTPLPQGPLRKRLVQRSRLLCSLFKQRWLGLLCKSTTFAKPKIAQAGAEIFFKNEPSFKVRSDRFPDLWLYNYRYNPPNFQRLNQQLVYFEQMLALAKSQGVACTVIDMPLTAQNRQLLHSGILSQYKQKVSELCLKYKADYRDLRTLCSPEEFEDSCHLNGVGGRKLFETIAADYAIGSPRKFNATTELSSAVSNRI